MKSFGSSAHACEVCGSIYTDAEQALACEAVAPDPEVIPPDTLVEVVDGAAETGPGQVTRSFLLGLGDPRGAAHSRFYRARFLWGTADFRAGDLRSLGPATEAEWREAVENMGESR